MIDLHRLARNACFTLSIAGALVAQPSQNASSPAGAALAISFGSNSVDVTGASPNGHVAFLGVAHEFSKSQPPVPNLVERAQIVTADQNGLAHLPLAGSVPLRAVWGAVDVLTGNFAMGPSDGFPAAKADPTSVVKNDNAGQLKKVEWPYTELELLLVRPGGGVWRLYVGKHADLDENKAHTFIRVDVKSFKPLDAAPPPAHFERGDILLLIDPHTMAYASIEVKP
jgi:hypothetical protein